MKHILAIVSLLILVSSVAGTTYAIRGEYNTSINIELNDNYTVEPTEIAETITKLRIYSEDGIENGYLKLSLKHEDTEHPNNIRSCRGINLYTENMSNLSYAEIYFNIHKRPLKQYSVNKSDIQTWKKEGNWTELNTEIVDERGEEITYKTRVSQLPNFFCSGWYEKNQEEAVPLKNISGRKSTPVLPALILTLIALIVGFTGVKIKEQRK